MQKPKTKRPRLFRQSDDSPVYPLARRRYPAGLGWIIAALYVGIIIGYLIAKLDLA